MSYWRFGCSDWLAGLTHLVFAAAGQSSVRLGSLWHFRRCRSQWIYDNVTRLARASPVHPVSPERAALP